ncbi:MAG TPA: glycosyltransferase family 2 protein [Ferruginibacter sp.]|jgi:glycosyltransferase involved in cell wall biosynthesis|nr:glycosyltransferase family 2 protein [Ferruginibacter sp.]
MNISVVIITKNEAHIIANTLQSVQAVTDDIVIVDSGSTDDTVAISKSYHANVIETGWSGYGINKNKGIAAAKYDWILSLDADEAIDSELQQTLSKLALTNEEEVFDIRFKNFFCNKWIRYGEWGFDWHIRLFNRKKVTWNNVAVHENLVFPEKVMVTKLKGNILHYTVRDRQEYDAKTDHYARMNAKKYAAAGKKNNFLRQYFSPVFGFIQHYIFRLGFLDGKEGFIIARNNARYTFLKYNYLKEMNKTQQ